MQIKVFTEIDVNKEFPDYYDFKSYEITFQYEDEYEDVITESFKILVPSVWKSPYIAIDKDGSGSVYEFKPVVDLYSDTWDLAEYEHDYKEILKINQDFDNWETLVQPIKDAVLKL